MRDEERAPGASAVNWAEQFFLEYEPGSPGFSEVTNLELGPLIDAGPIPPEFPTCDEDPDWRIVSEPLFRTPDEPGEANTILDF